MRSQPLIIRIGRHIFPDGRHCQGAAVRGRACCRHHLDARTRLHNMARARRCVRLPRLLVPETLRDLAYNEAEVRRVLATERIDPDAARMILWAMDFTAAALPAEPAVRLSRARNPNVSYHVPIKPLFARSCIENPSEVLENTDRTVEGVSPRSRLGNLTTERVGFHQPRRGAISKPGVLALGSGAGSARPGGLKYQSPALQRWGRPSIEPESRRDGR